MFVCGTVVFLPLRCSMVTSPMADSSFITASLPSVPIFSYFGVMACNPTEPISNDPSCLICTGSLAGVMKAATAVTSPMEWPLDNMS